MNEDPYIKAIEEQLTELEDHLRKNRAHQEQALYTEGLPRILALFRSFLDAIDSEPPATQEADGAFVAIRYQTAKAVEAALTETFERDKENENLAATLLLLLQDLHGVTEEEAINTALELSADKEAKKPE